LAKQRLNAIFTEIKPNHSVCMQYNAAASNEITEPSLCQSKTIQPHNCVLFVEALLRHL